LSDMFMGQSSFRFNRYNNRFYIDGNWDQFQPGSWLIIEAYQVVDPTVYTAAWGDRWLQMYATALIKRQWGSNLKKFLGIRMPGGVEFNGQQIFDEAEKEISYIEHEVINSYSLPAMDQIG